jgi:hypothetical protein
MPKQYVKTNKKELIFFLNLAKGQKDKNNNILKNRQKERRVSEKNINVNSIV